MQRLCKMIKKRWTEQEKLVLSDNISDSMLVSDMYKLIPNHPESGIARMAQKLNFGVNTKKGVRQFYADKRTRNRKKKTAKQIVGEPKTAPTVQEPTITSDCIDNKSDAIIPQDSNRDALISIYDDISALIECKNYTSIVSITVELVNSEFTLHGAAHEG